MVSTAPSRRLRLLAPVLALGVVGAGITVPRLADASDAAADLPPRTAAQLLEDVGTAQVDGLSGTVVATTRLGLPELPTGSAGGGAVTLPGLLSGSTKARVWKSGETRSRVAVDAPFAEYDVVRDGRDVWTYDSASKDVTHVVLAEGEPAPAPAPSGAATPQDAVEKILAGLDPTTAVSVGRAEMVADRPAYELVLDPRDRGTLIDTMRIAVDGTTSVPLRMQLFGVGQAEPAAEIAFTDVTFATPSASVFDFEPPTGATVTERKLGDATSGKRKDAPESAGSQARPTVHGTGWTSVVETTGVQIPDDAAGLVDQLAKPVQGGRVVTSAVLSVLLLDDGRVLAGAVPPARLVELAR